jgi:putative DNA primase/helicase
VVNLEKIPHELRLLKQWVCWRYEEHDGDPRKVPINARTGNRASTTNPKTWWTIEQSLDRLSEDSTIEGIGFVFRDDHIGVDLDHCIDDAGNVKPWAAEIVNACSTYTERSVRGQGLHLVSRGALPKDWPGRKRAYEDGAIEIYSRARYFTFTGNRLEKSPETCVDQSAYILELYKKLSSGNGHGKRNGNGNRSYSAAPMLQVSDIDMRLEVARRDPVFSRLWDGDTSAYNGDDSAADLAMCNKIVFYFGTNPDTIDRTFRQSKLYREKWERADYRTWTIEKAINGTQETYTPKGGKVQQEGRAKHRNGNDEEDAELDSAPVIPNLSNACRILQTDPLFKDRFYFDEFLNRIMTGDPPRPWTDADDVHLTVEIQREKRIPKMALETVSKAVIGVAFTNVKNCVKDWLESLTWDNQPRLEHFFEDDFGAPGNLYTRAVSKNFWIAIVARIYRPGCKADCMVILEGSQGIRKSTALGVIGGDYFAETQEPVSSKDFFQNLQGKLLIEIAELDSFDKADVTRVKAIVSRQVDTYRESYGRHSKDHPRRCIFVGTTNKDDWNRDSTGARRFWPITCTDIDVDSICSNREQLFAEAVYRFKAGETWWNTPAVETEAEQSRRYSEDVWIHDIETYIGALPRVTVREILVDCLKFDLAKISKPDQNRVIECLRRLRWRKSDKKVRTDKGVSHVWLPPSETATMATIDGNTSGIKAVAYVATF